MKRGEYLRIDGILAIFEKQDDNCILVSHPSTGHEKWFQLTSDENVWVSDETGNEVVVELQ